MTYLVPLKLKKHLQMSTVKIHLDNNTERAHQRT